LPTNLSRCRNTPEETKAASGRRTYTSPRLTHRQWLDPLSVWVWLIARVLFVLPDDPRRWVRDVSEDERIWFLTAAVAVACAVVVYVVGRRLRRREPAGVPPTLEAAYDVLMTALGVPLVLCLAIYPALLLARVIRMGVPNVTSEVVWVVLCLLVLGFWCGLRGRVLGCAVVGPLAIIACLAAVSGSLRTFAAETATDPTELILSVGCVVTGGFWACGGPLPTERQRSLQGRRRTQHDGPAPEGGAPVRALRLASHRAAPSTGLLYPDKTVGQEVLVALATQPGEKCRPGACPGITRGVPGPPTVVDHVAFPPLSAGRLSPAKQNLSDSWTGSYRPNR
jgi:hypothetical protein